MKSMGIAYLLWLFAGVFGVHRFYLGRVGTGLLWLFTFGFLGFGWLVDLFLIPSMVDHANLEAQILARGGPIMPVPHPRPMATPGHRVIYCPRCGGPMQVPLQAVGQLFHCPYCPSTIASPA